MSPALGVVICGSFESVGGAIGGWDGTAWRDLAGGVDGFGGFPRHRGARVRRRRVRPGDAANIAWFDGTAWHGLGAGIGDLSDALLVVDDVLYAGGPFTVAGGTPSAGIAAWDFRP